MNWIGWLLFIIIISIFFGLSFVVKYIVTNTSKSKNVKLVSWVAAALTFVFCSFFVVFAQIQTAEAERQAALALAAQQEAQEAHATPRRHYGRWICGPGGNSFLAGIENHGPWTGVVSETAVASTNREFRGCRRQYERF